MESIKEIIEWMGYFFAFLGFGASLYKTIDVWINLKNFSWEDVDRYTKKLIKELAADHFVPDVVVGIGRGGSIIGSLLSGNMMVPYYNKARNIPILGVDRLYDWENGKRIEIENKMVDFSPLKGKKVLLVAGDVLTGGTMNFFVQQLEEVGVTEIKTACLLKGVAATYKPDYFGKEIPSDFKAPWMYKGYGYSRDSRRPIEDIERIKHKK